MGAASGSSRRADWLIPALLILLGLVPAVGATARLTELAGDVELTAAAVMMGGAWLLNALVAESIIRKGHRGPGGGRMPLRLPVEARVAT